MFKTQIIVNGTLPGLNEIIDAAKWHWMKYRKLKSDGERLVAVAVNTQLLDTVTFTDCVERIRFFEPNRKRDRDNVIGGGLKIINDALVKTGVLADDSQKNVLSIEVSVEYSTEPQILIELEGENANESRLKRRRLRAGRQLNAKRVAATKQIRAQRHAVDRKPAGKPRPDPQR